MTQTCDGGAPNWPRLGGDGVSINFRTGQTWQKNFANDIEDLSMNTTMMESMMRRYYFSNSNTEFSNDLLEPAIQIFSY